MTNLHHFAIDALRHQSPHLAAAVQGITGVLADLGLDWDVARTRARHIVHALQCQETEAERVEAVTDALRPVASVITAHTVALVLMEWGRWERRREHDNG